jgi:flagellar biosynthetic protein FliQ
MDGLEMATELARRALMTAAELALPVLAVGLIVGLAIGVLQAMTQVHEQTVSFIPRLLAMGAAVLLLLPWFLDVITGYTREVFGGLGTVFLP